MTNRREFIKQVSAASIAGSVALPTDLLHQKNFARKELTPKIACWCDLGHGWNSNPPFTRGEDQVKREMDNVVKAGIDILIPQIQTHHFQTEVYYQSDAPNLEIKDRLTPLINLAKERGIQVHPMVIPNVELGLSKEEQRSRSYDNNQSGDNQNDSIRPCASWKRTREGGLNIMQDIIKNHTADGIHLDAIRYMDTGRSLKWPCQCAACQIEYRSLFGKDTITADDLKIPGILYKFLKFRGENIRSVVEQARRIAREAGLTLSMAARSDYFGSALVEGQDWVQWARDGLMDYICPMNYTTDRETHKRWLSGQMKLIGKSVPVYSGIGRGWGNNKITAAEMIHQAEDALELGASGITIFHYAAMGEKDFLELGAFKQANM